MFDLEELKCQSELSAEQLALLESQLRTEFTEDKLLLELHWVRVLEALQRGWITVEEALGMEAKAR